MIDIWRRNCINLIMSKVFICLLFTFLAGCAGVTIKDDLPPSSPKGYADFANYSFGRNVIYSMQDGKKVKEGSLTYTGQILRLARNPGIYDFIIEHEDDFGQKHSTLVNVKIMQDMLSLITFDRIIIEVTEGINDRFQSTRITYRTKISIAKTPTPVNFESVRDKVDIVSNLLNDPDWRARLYAISFLEKMEDPRDQRLIGRVRTLATDDQNKSVRKKADSFLKGLGIDVLKDLLLLENFESNNRTWIGPLGIYKFFYNDEFLFGSAEGACEDEMMKSPLDLPRDFDVELVSTWKSGTDGKEYGILVGSDKSNLDHFGISGYGQAVVRPIRNNEVSADLIAWTDVPAIAKHGAASNRLKIEVRGDTWKYYVNDAHIGAITNTMKMSSYATGLRVCGGQAVAFKQLKISRVRDN